MIRLITTLVIALFTFVFTVFSQEVSSTQTTNLTGDWYGQLDFQGQKMAIAFHITKKDGVYTTVLSSKSQSEIPTKSSKIHNNSIEIDIAIIKARFIGELKGDIIDGIFKQAGMDFLLVLSKTKSEIKQDLRPQDPKEPFNYISEEVVFVNNKANNIKLSGTLTLPKNVKNPAVAILITGTGPQNRNSEIFNHRPFLVMADYLTNNGIAVLRYDDRGVEKSEGTQKNTTSKILATDVEAAITYLKTRTDINFKKIGLIGHSEGGFIAPMIAAKDKTIAFIVSLAGTGVDGSQILLTQARKINELAGATTDVLDFNEMYIKSIHDVIIASKETDNLKENIILGIHKFKKENPNFYTNTITETQINQQADAFNNRWMAYFIKTSPVQFLNKVTCPVLALNGSKDIQVLSKLNLNGIKNALKNNKDVTITELKGLNHLFQKCETGALDEYVKIEETFNENALKIIADWINERF